MMGTIMGIPVIRSGSPPRDLPGLKIGHFNDYAGLTITLPACVSRKDFERITAEIQAALDWAEQRGEQKALAFLLGDGVGEPIGIVGQPELTPEQAKYFEMREKDGWHSYGTPPDPIPEAWKRAIEEG